LANPEHPDAELERGSGPNVQKTLTETFEIEVFLQLDHVVPVNPSTSQGRVRGDRNAAPAKTLAAKKVRSVELTALRPLFYREHQQRPDLAAHIP
jgi:hypothetical protein